MKRANCYLLKPFQKYKKFLEVCNIKKYSKQLVLHKHHVIPKHLWDSIENKEFVRLSVKDHIQAHLLLSKCFEAGTYEHAANLRSARILNKKSIRDIKTLKSISKTYEGENNPFYGKTHTETTKKILADNTRLQCYGITYTERYGIKSNEEKKKRSKGVKLSWKLLSEENKKIRSINISTSLKGKMIGKNNPASYPLLVDEIRFECLQEALNFYGVSKYKLFKFHSVLKLEK
jgi:hypothetical protein